MNILFTASELAPYAKTGGLGEVMASLPPALASRKHTISVVVPLYRTLRESLPSVTKTNLRLPVVCGHTRVMVPVWQGKLAGGVTLFAIQKDEYFDRSGMYGNEDGEYHDQAERFAFFSRAVVELAKYIDPLVDVIHAHDWHTALVPVYVRAWNLPFRTVLTLHTLAYQGAFAPSAFATTHLPPEYFTPEGVEFYSRVNFLKGGIRLCDALTTVSPAYAREIQFEQYGMGLNRVIEEMNYKLAGILNGIDTKIWNPESDKKIASPYNARKLDAKETCKQDLLKTLRFRGTKEAPLLGLLSRFAPPKGMNRILELMPEILNRGVRIVIHGSGESSIEQAFLEIAAQYPKQVATVIGYDETLAHQIIAGCDFLLMPSEFEPCGLTQMYAMRYGTIPIVSDVGGLSDTVEDWDGIKGTGFRCIEPFHTEFPRKLDAALATMRDEKAWLKIRRNAMRKEFSWKNSLKLYEKVYEQLQTR